MAGVPTPGGASLPEVFDIQQATSTRDALACALDDAAGVSVDGSGVRRTDAAAMQVLAAAALEARRRHIPFTLSASPVIADAAAVLGLADVLGLAPRALP